MTLEKWWTGKVSESLTKISSNEYERREIEENKYKQFLSYIEEKEEQKMIFKKRK